MPFFSYSFNDILSPSMNNDNRKQGLPSIKNLYNEEYIEYTNKKIENDSYCIVKKYTNDLYQELSDTELCTELLGSDYNEYLDYTYRVY